MIKTSKTRINKKLKRKTNPELIESIILAKKNKNWRDIANLISKPRRQLLSRNLDELNEIGKEGDTLLVPGKVLSNGQVSKKMKIVALSFSEEARKKLKEKKCEAITIREEIKLNPKAEGITIVR